MRGTSLRRGAAACAAVLLLAACGGSSDGSDDDATAAPAAPAATGTDEAPAPSEPEPSEPEPADAADPVAPQVEVTDTGAEPRETLRYAFTADTSVSGVMRMTMEQTELAIDGEPVPTGMPALPMESDLTLEVGAVDDDGADVRYTIDAMRLGEVDLPDAERAQIEAGLDAAAGVTGTYRIDARGRVTDGNFEATDAPGLEQFGDQLAALATPLPEEPVGPGAVWTITQSTVAGGLPLEQVIEVRLVERDGDLLTLEMTIEGTSPAGPVELDAAPGVQVDLVHGRTTGTSSVVADLTSPFPRGAETTAETHQELRLDDGNGTSAMQQSMRMTGTLERS